MFEGIATPEVQKYSSELKTLELEWFIKFVNEKEPISRFDYYIQQWMNKGGKDLLKSLTEEYNNRNGTNYVPGY